MPKRKRLKSNRFLPDYVTSFKDRHGKTRYRFRRKGYKEGYIRFPIGTEEFREEYSRLNNADNNITSTHNMEANNIIPGSVAHLKIKYYEVQGRLGPTQTTRIKIMSVLNRGFFDGREDRPVRAIRFDHIDAIIANRLIKTQNTETGRHEGGVEAARKLRKELVRLFEFAEKIGMINKSPMHHAGRVKTAANESTKGFHSWTEPEIAQFRARHPIGSKARLAMELLLWTDQRGIDSMHIGNSHIKDGRFEIRQSKTGTILILPIAPQLLEAIVAMPLVPDSECFLVSEWNRPYSRKGFGNKFREWCDQANLSHCSAHGLRKATLRRMADLEMSNKSMKSVSGHVKDEEIEHYTKDANQKRLAQNAIQQLSDWEKAPPVDEGDELAAAAKAALSKWSAGKS